ncbi:MAG: PIG-L family deacetylase [Verrucomicrobiota bacterium]
MDPYSEQCGIRRVAVVVAHPDDETLWAGGLLLSHPAWSPFIVTLCRGKDPDRAPKFRSALDCLNAQGRMGDLDDGPEQVPLPDNLVRDTILELLPGRDYDLLLTHSPSGEYTSHRRHEEVSQAVLGLWRDGILRVKKLWQFAYEDGGGTHRPRPRMSASLRVPLSDALWMRKYDIITRVYGFSPVSWEAQVIPRTEAFHCFSHQAATPPSVAHV